MTGDQFFSVTVAVNCGTTATVKAFAMHANNNTDINKNLFKAGSDTKFIWQIISAIDGMLL